MDINEIKYLTFEGGGGKGVVYLGAIQGLEDIFKPILEKEGKALGTQTMPTTNPTPPNTTNLNEFTVEDRIPLIGLTKPPELRQIKGISGSSAGAITAFMLAMGMNSIEIKKEMEKSTPFKFNTIGTKPITPFENFFDNPSDFHKEVTKDSRSRTYTNISNIVRGIINSLKSIYNPSALGAIHKATKVFFKAVKVDGMLETQLLHEGMDKDKDGNTKTMFYFYNLFFTRGFFTGEPVRTYFEELMQTNLLDKIDEIDLQKIEKAPKDITFKDFYFMTGVDLILTGVNISRHQPMYFSLHHTPDFPVTEAVGISMNIPIIFKPIWVDFEVRKGDKNQNIKYQGLWGDGGLLNNYPIHAFDNIEEQEADYQGTSSSRSIASEVKNNREFCNCVLGFRLTDLQESKELEKELKEKAIFPENSFIIGDYFKNLYETIMYPAEGGQIRTAIEEQNTININTRFVSDKSNIPLEMTDFSTPKMDKERGNKELAEAKEKLIEEAREKVLEKFKD